MLPGSNHGKTCLETMRKWEFTTFPPPLKIPHHNSSDSWIIFWKSWVIFWILIWTQDGEMASSLNFRFLLCSGGQTLDCSLHLPLCVQRAETCNDKMSWHPFWPYIIGNVHSRCIFLGHQRLWHDGKIPWVCVSTAFVTLLEAGSTEDVVVDFLLEIQHGEFLLIWLLCADLGDSNIEFMEEKSDIKQYIKICLVKSW